MTPAPTMPPFVSSRALDARTVAGVLDEAVMRRAPVQLYPHGSTDIVLRRGSIKQADEKGLLIEPVDRLAEFPPLRRGTHVQAALCVRDRAYMIQSWVVDPTPGDRIGAIRLHPPEKMELIERRRNPRRRLHPSTPVEIHLPTAEGELRAGAHILNVSEKGLACRVATRLAVRFSEGQFVWIHFQLGADSEPFDLDGRVVSITPAATGAPTHALVGIEFLEGEKLDACLKRLRHSLSLVEPAGPVETVRR